MSDQTFFACGTERPFPSEPRLMDTAALIEMAAALARPFVASDEVTSGSVAAALVTAAGTIYTGVCVDTRCSLGFCAEHAAVAEMLKARETDVRILVAVTSTGEILAPCGRCRELLWQVSPANRSTWVVLSPTTGRRLDELLPAR
jgi:cytidine deaminase